MFRGCCEPGKVAEGRADTCSGWQAQATASVYFREQETRLTNIAYGYEEGFSGGFAQGHV